MFGSAWKLRLDFDYLGSRPRDRIENHGWHAVALSVNVSQYFVERAICDLLRGAGYVFEISFGVEIIHSDPGARHNVVKVIKQQILPGKLELIMRVRAAVERSQRTVFLGVKHKFLVMPDSLFCVG